MTWQSALYVGRVRHHRFRPRPHALTYRVFWMLLDLDEVEQLSAKLKFFSHDRFNLYALRMSDFGDRSGRPLRPQIEQVLEKAGIAHDGGPIRLLTMPRILGYAFNPLSTYFCYRRDGSLCATVYEVHNTFGEIHSYVAPAATADGVTRQETGKVFHVSPFMDLDMLYLFTVTPPEDRVSVAIEGSDPEGRLITAVLSGERMELSDAALLRLLATHPLLTLKVTAAIHWHALRLLAKRISWRRHPGAPAHAFSLGRAVTSHAKGPRQP